MQNWSRDTVLGLLPLFLEKLLDFCSSWLSQLPRVDWLACCIVLYYGFLIFKDFPAFLKGLRWANRLASSPKKRFLFYTGLMLLLLGLYGFIYSIRQLQ